MKNYTHYSSFGDIAFLILHEDLEPTRAEIMDGINRRYQSLIGMDDGEFFDAVGIMDTLEDETDDEDSI